MCAIFFKKFCVNPHGFASLSLAIGKWRRFRVANSGSLRLSRQMLGLMAIHLLLLAANRVRADLPGSIGMHSDWTGALHKVEHIPRDRIPMCCRHSDILKNVMVNCSKLTFDMTYHHVRAHQDDHKQYEKLLRPSQLNRIVDLHAKQAIWGLNGDELPPQEVFPLEPIAVFVRQEKMTSDSDDSIRF